MSHLIPRSLRRALIAGVALAALSTGIARAQAAPGGTDERIRKLEAEVEALRSQISDLKQSVAHPAAPPTPAVKVQPAPPPRPEAVTASLSGGKPQLATADGRFSFQPRLMLQVDAGAYQQAAAGPLATDLRRGSLGDAAQASHARDLSDGVNVRRARLGFAGKAFGDFDYSFVTEFGGAGNAGGATLTEGSITYSGVKPLRLRAGVFAAPTGLEDATSVTQSLFEERPTIAEMVRATAGGDGRAGVAAYAGGKTWFGSLAWTGNGFGVSNNGAQSAILARVAWAPLRGEDWTTHLGVNTSYIVTPGDNGPDVTSGRYALRLRDRPELRLDATQLIDTGNIDAAHYASAGLELGAQWKSFYLAGEYETLSIQRRGSSLADPRFAGWYVQGSWFPTGERRRWNPAAGGFDGPVVAHPFDLAKGDLGAVELAARYSVADLNYHAGALGSAPSADAVRGGEQTAWTVGANWYFNSLVKLAAQYQDVEIDRLSPGGTAFGAGSLTPPAGAQVGQRVKAFALRTQVAF